MIRVLVVDDHPIVRDGLAGLIDLQEDMELAGEAGTGPDAVARALELQPDLVLMDLQLPGFTGAEATKRIKEALPSTQVLVLTAYDSDEALLDAVRAGASGYVLKETPRAELLRSIRLVAAGGSLLQPGLVARLLDRSRESVPAHEPLTEREVAVLKLMVDGLRNKEIADALFIAERTVKFHAGIIFQKLGVTNRAEAVALALKRGIVK